MSESELTKKLKKIFEDFKLDIEGRIILILYSTILIAKTNLNTISITTFN